ncbi:MAG: hypothetical protein ACFFCX_16215 [Candidatus Sifarchaeia archaeon]
MSQSKSKPKLKPIPVRGLGLSIRLFRMNNMTLSPNQLMTKLKDVTYSPTTGKEKKLGAGFSNVKLDGKTVTADFMADFRVLIRTHEADGFSTKPYYSVDNGSVLVKFDRKTMEVRGSERIASRIRRILVEQSGATIEPLNLNGGAKTLYDLATDVDAVLVTGVEKGNLTQAEFKGGGLQSEEEVGMYTRRYKGVIARFRGIFEYPSPRTSLKTSVNGAAGSIVIWTSDELSERNVRWIVKMMEDSAPP